MSFNSSCDYAKAACKTATASLVNYLTITLCMFQYRAQPLGFVLLALWLVFLIALLATVVDGFFVPPLVMLSEKLRLPPNVAGMTLMAVGNGAADVFVVYCALAQDDVPLVLGTLSGGGMFITTIVIGTLVLTAKGSNYNINRMDFMRDIVAYLIVMSSVVIVAVDGKVHLLEAVLLPVAYLVYILTVIVINYIQLWREYKKSKQADSEQLWEDILKVRSVSFERSLPLRYIARAMAADLMETLTMAQKSRDPIVVNSSKQSVIVPGLTWPADSHILLKFLWFIQWPFVFLLWATVPPCCHDGRWSQWHYTFAVLSPLPIALLLLTASKGWEGYVIFVGPIPLVVILAIVGVVLSVLLLLILSPQKSPHWTLQIVLILAAFATSITWLNIIANEIISILQTFGILFDINTAILGLTILAAGNSMADLVADTVIARAGKPEMAFACCFGSPLLSNVLGLSIAFTVKISLGNNGDPYQIDIQNTDYSQVKLSWIFLGASLLLTVAFFPIFKFNPPRAYGAVLIALYMVFLMFCLLTAVNVIPLSV
ncbi:hypothetical protein EMCRGX_G027989 [Ephydatia muelleri]